MGRRCLPPLRLILAAAVVVALVVAAGPSHWSAHHWGATAALPPPRPPGADSALASPGFSRPALLVSRLDASYGTPTRRLTTSTVTNEFTSILRAGAQAEDPGGRWVLVYGGTELARLPISVVQRRDGRLLKPSLISTGGLPHWGPGRGGAKVVYFNGFNGFGGSSTSLELHSVDVASGTASILSPSTESPSLGEKGGMGQVLFAANPRAYLEHWTVSYPSRDGRRYALWTDSSPGAAVRGVAVMDVRSSPPTLLGSLFSWPSSRGRVLAARITPSGGAVLVHFEAAGVYVYDASLSGAGRRVMATRLLTDDAADVMVAAGSGHDMLVAINDEAGSEDGGWVVAVDLVNLSRSPLFPLPRDNGIRGIQPRVTLSGAAYDRPGWIIAAADACNAGAAGDWLCGKVVAMKVATRLVVPLGHTHACEQRRDTPVAAATANRDLSRVYFSSDSGLCRGKMELFELTTTARMESAIGGGGGPPPPPSVVPPPPSVVPPPSKGPSRGLPTEEINVGIAI